LTIRIAHLSDIHFGGEEKAAVEAAIAQLHGFAPDLTVVTGDLTLNGLPAEFSAARDWLHRLPPPLLVTPGNHDTPYWNLLLRALVPFDRYERFIGPAAASAYDAPGLSARTLNSARGAQPRPDWSKGAIDMNRLRTLGWSNGPALKLFACHHPLIDIVDSPVTGHTRGGRAAAAMLADQRVELVLTGHVHVPFAVPLPEAPWTCYALGAGTLSIRTRGTPASFSTIVAEPGVFEVCVHGWVEGRFETIETRRLIRAGATSTPEPAPPVHTPAS
jgi:3',5'-cyclic AMP phosphodiesterase CpdA